MQQPAQSADPSGKWDVAITQDDPLNLWIHWIDNLYTKTSLKIRYDPAENQ